MEHSLEVIKCQAIKQVSVNLRKLARIFSDHSAMRLQNQPKTKQNKQIKTTAKKPPETLRLNYILLNNKLITEEIRNTLRQLKTKHNYPINLWDAKKQFFEGTLQ